jgi:FkbM family methyltransferase
VTDWIQKNVAAAYDGVDLFGKHVSPPTGTARAWEDFLVLYYQVVIQDQYESKLLLKPDSVVIDGGANIGLFSVVASQYAPKGKVYSFEPAKLTFTALSRNTKDCTNVEAVNSGLGDKACKAEMMVHQGWPSGSTLSDSGMAVIGAEKGDLVPEQVSVTTIDAFTQERGLKKLDFVKVDAEGYEKQILRGAAGAIRRFRPVLAVSAYHFPNDKQDIVQIVKGIYPGYSHRLSSAAEEDLFFLPDTR